jgi:uncharacterized protein with NAD-binding domain and iron-sulfur cluster
MTTVAVLGGGVAGLSAAHELAERGFAVTVYEHRDAPGGKARSIPYAGSGTGGRADLPGEHGFRFFPGFYRHLPDTMGRIPFAGRTVRDHLVGATRILFAQAGGPNEIIAPAHLPESAEDFAVLARFLREAATQVGVPPQEYAVLIERLLTLLTSCDERREQQWELQSWWEYTGAERRSAAFQRFLADGLTRTLVAARGREMSARTGGLVLVQLLQDLSRAGGRADRVLDAPTSEVWIDPWVEHLTARGVELRLSEPVEALHLSGGRLSGATVAGRTVHADHYVAALPVEVMRQLASPALRAAEPRLKGLDRLVTRWMNGVLFYLDRDIPLVNGHAIYVDSEWALTSISQKQFWPGVDLAQRGDGRTRGILSIDVSEWQRPGKRTGKVAQLCTREEIFDEVWGQLEDHLDGALDAATVIDRFLDPAIVFPNPTGAANLEPLLVNTAGSWADRPDAATRIPNLFLASDYVRTHTDLATMEAANEAARRAVNGILDATGSRERRCEVWPLREPQVFAAARALDKVRWKLFHRPAKPPLELTADLELRPTGPVARGLLGVSGLLRRVRGR